MRRAGAPLEADADQRYWRRRANRRVRKARLTRLALRWTGLVAAHLAVAAMALYGGIRVFIGFTSTDEFRVRRLEIEGTHRASDAALRARLAPWVGQNLFDLDLAGAAEAVTGDPWIRSASAKRILPDTLRVAVVERVPCAVALIGGVAHVVDGTGHVIRPSGPDVADDLPVLTGLDGRDERALVVALRRGVTVIQELEAAVDHWLPELSELDLSNRDRVAVRTVDPGPIILLDPQRIERNVAEYLELRREIVRLAGPLATVDLRWRDQISVRPRTPIPPREDS
jgi:cell division septal protein FtsQ